MEQIKGTIKVKEKVWNSMLSGKKKHLIRKLLDGLESGTYEFVSIKESHYCSECDEWNANDYCESCEKEDFMIMKSDITYGTVYLSPIGVNTMFDYSRYNEETNTVPTLVPRLQNVIDIDIDTYYWVEENYIDKKIDYVIYELSNVKENE